MSNQGGQQSKKNSEASISSVGNGLGDVPSPPNIRGRRPIAKNTPEGYVEGGDQDENYDTGHEPLNKTSHMDASVNATGNNAALSRPAQAVSQMSISSQAFTRSSSQDAIPAQRFIPLQPLPLPSITPSAIPAPQAARRFGPFAQRPSVEPRGRNGQDPVAAFLSNPTANQSGNVQDRPIYDPMLRSVLRTCWQNSAVPMDILFSQVENLKKIGEGVYGEVFKGNYQNERTRVFKIVPMGGTQKVNNETQKTFEEMESEILISQEVTKMADGFRKSKAPCFCKLHSARVCIGEYYCKLLKEWKNWHKENKSDNDEPIFDQNQYYAIFEYEYAGDDLETFVFSSAKQSFSLLMQVCHTLAAGESALAFEHRDLHW